MSTPATNLLGRDPLELESILRRLASRLARQENLITLPWNCLIRFTIEKAMKEDKESVRISLDDTLCHTDNATPPTGQYLREVSRK